VLVLSEMVLVIVIDARSVGMARIGGPRNTRMTRKGDRGWRDRGDRAWLGILCGGWFWGSMVVWFFGVMWVWWGLLGVG
jgi:hypothetical protein